MRKVIGLGSGGHAKVVIEILRCHEAYELVGLLDPKKELWGKHVLGVPVLGDDSLLSTLPDDGVGRGFTSSSSRPVLGGHLSVASPQ